MAVFRQKGDDNGMTRHSPGSTAEHINMIGEGTLLEGSITSPGDIHVRGRVVGKIQAEGRAVLAQEGVVEGEIFASNADIAGRVEGDVHVETRLILKSSARIEGTIYTNRLVVEEGAIYNGKCEMGKAASEQTRRPSVSEEVDEQE